MDPAEDQFGARDAHAVDNGISHIQAVNGMAQLDRRRDGGQACWRRGLAALRLLLDGAAGQAPQLKQRHAPRRNAVERKSPWPRDAMVRLLWLHLAARGQRNAARCSPTPAAAPWSRLFTQPT